MGKWLFKLALIVMLVLSILACSSGEVEKLTNQLEEKDAKIKELENQLELFGSDCADEVTKVTDELKEKTKEYNECYSGLIEVQKKVSEDVALPVIGEKDYEGFLLHNLGPFTLMLPKEMKKQETRGIDSLVAQFMGGGYTVYLDYGAYTGPIQVQEKYQNVELRDEIINHNDAQLLFYTEDGKNKAQAYFPDNKIHARLTIYVTYDEHKYIAERILRSVKFN